MSNEHYRSTYYSKEEAEEVVKKNEDMMNARGRQITAARRGVDTIKEANQMGMTVAEYLELIE